MRLGAYQSLDLTISEALNQRSPDFPGVVICTASDSLGTLMQLIKKRRVHRLVVVEGDVSTSPYYTLFHAQSSTQEDERRGGKKGRLLGIITLSDVLRYLIGDITIGETQPEPHAVPPEASPPDPAAVPGRAPSETAASDPPVPEEAVPPPPEEA